MRTQLQTLNNIELTDGEWLRFLETYLDKPSDNIVDKTRKIHDDYIDDFVFDDGRIKNIYLLDKKNIARNKVQVIKQFEQTGSHANRYDVTILVNGLPLVQIELKKRGVASVIEAFFAFAQAEQQREAEELINSENLNLDAARRYITTSLKREYASDAGTELNAILPKMSPLNPQYLTKKQSVFQKIAAFVEKFKGVGGSI